MSMNAIQFQSGLSLDAFLQRYGTEQQCEQAVVAARWPQGWRCAHCGCKRCFLTRNGPGRQLLECIVCGYPPRRRWACLGRPGGPSVGP